MPTLDPLRRFGASFPWVLRALGRGFFSYGHVMGLFLTVLIMSLIYWLVLPFFTFLKLGDPLKCRPNPGAASYWEDWKQNEQTVDRYSRPF